VSRTRKGTKGPGHEYWSRRPCNGFNYSKEHKTITHQIERAREKKLVQDEIKEMENEDGDNDGLQTGQQ
jgi:hypothetical protein